MPGGLAARVAGWQRRAANTPGPLAASGEQPTGPLMVELCIGGVWTDITSFVLTRDGSGRIEITTGQSGEGAAIQPGSCRFEVNNRDGRFSPRNPVGPYYGGIGRNTPMRVSVENGNAKDCRFWGEISAWPVGWDTSGVDVWVDVEAAGILRRLSQGSAPLRSTMYRGLTSPSTSPAPVAYWPCEDMDQATSIASGLTGGRPMAITGTPDLASFEGFVCSAPLPVMADGSFTGNVPSYALTGQAQVRFLLAVPEAGATDQQTLCVITTNGLVKRWEVTYGTGGTLELTGRDADGSAWNSTGPVAFDVDGVLLRVSVELRETATSDIEVTLGTMDPGAATGFSVTQTWGSLTFGIVKTLTMAPDGDLTDIAIGHISVQPGVTALLDLVDQLEAYAGESAGARIQRLQTEEGLAFDQLGTLTDTVLMGPQGQQTLLALVQECAAVDMGVLFELWAAFGLGYRTRVDLENQTPGLALTYTAGQLAAVPAPVEDDQNTRNDWTVARTGGSSARAVLETGALSVLAPPNGVGRYDDSITVNVADDDLLGDQAGWRLHLGTVDEARYPQIAVNLSHPSFGPGTSLRADALGLRPGDRITISDTPAWLPPGDISLLVLGRTETIDGFVHTIVFACTPESPYQVAVVDDGEDRTDSGGCVLAADVTPAVTAVDVVTVTGARWVDSATFPDDFPFDVAVGGEVMTVTACTGTGASQTLTVTRSVNGVIKSHRSGADVRLARPAIVAL